MDVAVSWLVIIGPLLIGLASTIWYGSGRTPALWIGFTGAVLLFLAGALQCQQWIWKSSNLAPQAQAQEKQMPVDNPKQPVISGSGNIVTFGQSGGQNVINQAPKPELKQLHNDVRQNSDGSQTISILTEVVAAYPPGSLFIQATAPHIAALNVIPQRTGMSMTGHTGQRKNYAFTTLMNPFGTYMIDVQTSKPEQVTIEYHFE